MHTEHIYSNRGLVVRLIYLAAAILCWFLTGFGRLFPGRVITLCYHCITPRQRRRFERQMKAIAPRAISAADAGNPRRNALAAPPVCVTFDDAFENLLENALPITRRYEIPVIIFAVTGNLSSTPLWDIASDHPDAGEVTMTEQHLAYLAEDPLCMLGSHSMTHQHLTDQNLDQARLELGGSKMALEVISGEAVVDFAFPYGECSDVLIEVALAAGYKRVYVPDYTSASAKFSDHIIRRTQMSPDAWPIEFALTAVGAYRWLGPLRLFIKRIRLSVFSESQSHSPQHRRMEDAA